MPGKCQFQDLWLDDNHWNKWLRKKDKYTAFCCFCKKTFDISHSGINSIKSHEKGKKHLQFDLNLKTGKQMTLHSFTSAGSSTSSEGLVSNITEGPSTSHRSDSLSIAEPSQIIGHGSDTSNVSSNRSVISSFVINDSVTKAEILWTINCVMTQTSLRSGSVAVDLFPAMFPDSTIAQKLTMHKDKISYSVTYGLGPHFSNLVLSEAKQSPFYALSVDEALNDICQKQQMDVMIKYWDVNKSSVSTRYLTSTFLEQSYAIDLLEKIIKVIDDAQLPLKNLVQLSTDGPNVNLKLLSDLTSYMKDSLENECTLLDIGTCSLHIVNGAYKTGHTKVGWKINQFLSSLYRLFKNYPSRRAVYTKITGSSTFPKKFCAIRWTENSTVIRRSLEMMPHLKRYVENIKTPPETENFSIVKDFILKDKTLEGKLHFSAMIAEELEEFLTCFQKNDPLLPFLHLEVFRLMKSLGSRFIKKNIIDSANTSTKLKRIDLQSEQNLKPFENIDVGFGARSILKNVKELDVQKFKFDCKTFLVTMFEKLIEKSPLKKRFVLGATCLNPTVMASEELRASRVKVAIEELVVHNQMSPSDGDIVMREYLKFCECEGVKEGLKNYNWKKEKLDNLFCELFKLFKEEDLNKKFIKFVWRILICFHGNAAVERSFSFNKNFLVENLQEVSLIAQRSLHDYINTLPGGIKSLNVTKRMMHDFRNASSRRKEDLKLKKDAQDEAVKEKKRASQQFKQLQLKKQKFLDEKNQELSLIESKLSSLQKKF